MRVHDDLPLNYADRLDEMLRRAAPMKKGERTRLRLKMAAARMFEKDGYHAVRVSDIARPAGISMASFYVYFQNKRDITFEVLGDFSRYILEQLRAVRPSDDVYGAIHAANLAYLKLTQANAGLMRCLVQYSDEDADFRRSFQAITHEWNLHTNRGLRRRFAELRVDDNQRLLSIYLLGGMLDQLVRDLYVSKNPHVRDLIEGAGLGVEDLSAMISRIWLNGLQTVGAEDAKPSAATRVSSIKSRRRSA